MLQNLISLMPYLTENTEGCYELVFIDFINQLVFIPQVFNGTSVQLKKADPETSVAVFNAWQQFMKSVSIFDVDIEHISQENIEKQQQIIKNVDIRNLGENHD